MSASNEPPPALLLTGQPGVGKTTVVKKAARMLGDRVVRGFITEEIRRKGSRRGFRLVPLGGGEPRVLAHVENDAQARVGKYGVDVEMLDDVATSLLRPDPTVDLYIIDEIGKMECFSSRFVEGVRFLLDSGTPILGTLARRGGGFITEVKARRDIELWEVTRATRDELPVRIVDWLERLEGQNADA